MQNQNKNPNKAKVKFKLKTITKSNGNYQTENSPKYKTQGTKPRIVTLKLCWNVDKLVRIGSERKLSQRHLCLL